MGGVETEDYRDLLAAGPTPGSTRLYLKGLKERQDT